MKVGGLINNKLMSKVSGLQLINNKLRSKVSGLQLIKKKLVCEVSKQRLCWSQKENLDPFIFGSSELEKEDLIHQKKLRGNLVELR